MSLPWETLATEETKDGPLVLRKRGDKDYLITIRGRILMSSAAHRSEDALAKFGCAHLREKKTPRVLISGLGMGYTLRAALNELGPYAKVHIAELNAVVAAWCRGPLAALTESAANDPRVTVEVIDVAKAIATGSKKPADERYDAIVLDMYEGPQGRVDAWDPLYSESAMHVTYAALVASGTLAVWCEAASPGFEKALRAAGFAFKLERAGKGARVHWIYVAKAQSKAEATRTGRRSRA